MAAILDVAVEEHQRAKTVKTDWAALREDHHRELVAALCFSEPPVAATMTVEEL